MITPMSDMPKKQFIAEDAVAPSGNTDNLIGEVFDIANTDLVDDKVLLRKIDLRLMPLL